MKPDTVFKRSYNDAMDLLGQLAPGAALPSESQLCLALGVSRTTVRKVLRALAEAGLISADKRLLRPPA